MSVEMSQSGAVPLQAPALPAQVYQAPVYQQPAQVYQPPAPYRPTAQESVALLAQQFASRAEQKSTNWAFVILGIVVLFIVIGVIVYLVRKSSIDDGGGGKTPGKKSKNYGGVYKNVDRFQLVLDGKYLSSENGNLTLSGNPSWDTYWSWDGTYLKLNMNGKNVWIDVPNNGNPVKTVNQQVDNVKLVIGDSSSVGITSNSLTYNLKVNGNGFKWVTGTETQLFKLTLPSKDRQNIGDTCTEKQTCVEGSSCVDGTCLTCDASGKPTCKPFEYARCDNEKKSWACVSRCEGEPKKCEDGATVECKLVNNEWKWSCETNCTGDRPATCPKSVCEKNTSGAYEYKCVIEDCGTTVPPPAVPPGYTLVKFNECVGGSDKANCYKSGSEYVLQSYNCDTKTWDLKKTCGVSDKPSCSGSEEPSCTVLSPEFCGTKSGSKWVCPGSPSDWCELGSVNRLVPHNNVCIDGKVGDTCNTTVYSTTAGVPVYPTISYNNCSQPNKNTLNIPANVVSVNPKGYLEDDGDGRLTLYPSDGKEVTINGVTSYYSDKYLYYKPKGVQAGISPQICLMSNKETCKNGTFGINTANRVENNARISTDPRDSGNEGPPSITEMGKVGTCACNTGFAGPNCDQTPQAMCNNNGNIITDQNGNLSCACNPGFGGSACKFSNADCSNNGVISRDSKDTAVCDCNFGYTGSKCETIEPGANIFNKTHTYYVKNADNGYLSVTPEGLIVYKPKRLGAGTGTIWTIKTTGTFFTRTVKLKDKFIPIDTLWYPWVDTNTNKISMKTKADPTVRTFLKQVKSTINGQSITKYRLESQLTSARGGATYFWDPIPNTDGTINALLKPTDACYDWNYEDNGTKARS